MEESIHVRFDDKLDSEKSKLVEKLADLKITFLEPEEKASEVITSEVPTSDTVDVPSDPPQQKKSSITTSHPEELILGDKEAPVRTRSAFKPSEEMLLGLLSLIEPTSIEEALLDKD